MYLSIIPTSRRRAGFALALLVPALLLLGLCPGTALGATNVPGGTSVLGGTSVWPVPTRHFSWPLAPPHPVLRPFQPPSTPYGPGHRGVDLGGMIGEAVFAAGDGLVLYAGPLADRSLVSIEHLGGLRTTYEPITPAVKVGELVSRGQLIGYLLPGHLGCPLPPAGTPPAGTPPGGIPATGPPTAAPLAAQSPTGPSPTGPSTAGRSTVGPLLAGPSMAGSRAAGPPPAESPLAESQLAGPLTAGAIAAVPSTGGEPAGGSAGASGVQVCLHWGAHRGRDYLDPLRLVESGLIRLLPWPADAG